MNTTKILIASLLFLGCLTANAKKSGLSDFEKDEMQKAISYYDNNKPDIAIDIYNNLLADNPKSYIINYELALAKVAKGEYAEALKITQKIERNSDVEDKLFQLQGNVHDYMGNRKKAIASYDKGLKKFPKAGCLYMEKGNIMLMENDPNGAINLYEKAMEVEPAYSSPYYRASALFLGSTEPIWGLIYGETFLLLEKGQRNVAIQDAMVKRLGQAIKLENDTLHVSLTQQHTVNMKGLNLIIPFELLYELEILKSPAIDKLKSEKRDTITISDFIEIRKVAANAYKDWENRYPNYLFEYQKKVIDAGYFEAYTMDLFKDVYADEYKTYVANEENQKTLDAYKAWMTKNPFEPNENKLIIRKEPQ